MVMMAVTVAPSQPHPHTHTQLIEGHHCRLIYTIMYMYMYVYIHVESSRGIMHRMNGYWLAPVVPWRFCTCTGTDKSALWYGITRTFR